MVTNHRKLSGQKILVTGASGFIGPHLCRALCRLEAEIHAVSRKALPNSGKCPHWWQSDLSEISATRSLLETIRPEIIFHLAGYAVGGRELGLVYPTFQSNLMTTVNLLAVATEMGCRRIVVAGSLEEPTPEDIEIIPSSPYAAAKWASSAYARMFYQLYRTPIVIARIFMTYGPGEPNPNKIIPYVIKSLLQGESPKLSSGKREVDWVYVEDVVEGLMKAAEAENIEGCTVDLGSGELISIRVVVEKLFNILGLDSKPLFGSLGDRPLEQIRVADTKSSRARLGWLPQTSLEEGLKRTVDWYKKQIEMEVETQE